ncbi:MAG: phage portal protein [Shinella sp.]|nr:phage portal protein [Shinella sp.]
MLNRLRNLFSGKRSYQAAGGGRRGQSMQTMHHQLHSIAAARGTLAARARYLAANNPLAASAVEAWVSALVGTGVKGQAKAPAPLRNTLNVAFETWTDESDADGLTDFYGQQDLIIRRVVIDGEALAVFVQEGDQIRLRVLEAEQLDASHTATLSNGNVVVQGVEHDAKGRRVAFHIFDRPAGMELGVARQRSRYPASEVLHVFRRIVPGQVRGVTWFAPVMVRLNDLDGWRDAEMMRQRVASLFVGFVIAPDGTAAPLDGDQQGTAVSGAMAPGTLTYLSEPGQDIRFSDPAKIGQETIQFADITEREIAVGLGLPDYLLSGDLSDVNYSSIRAGMVEFRRRVEALQHSLLAFQFLRPVWRRWATLECISGRVEASTAEVLPVAWITPRQHWVDPSKDVIAEIDAINAGLMSRREAVAARGVDIEQLDAEIAADNQRAASLGLTFTTPPPRPPANDNQPAAKAA